MDIICRIESDGLDGICRIKQDGIYLVITNTHVRSLIDLYQNHCIYSRVHIAGGGNVMCVCPYQKSVRLLKLSVSYACAAIKNPSVKHGDWLSHVRPAPFPFHLLLCPGIIYRKHMLMFKGLLLGAETSCVCVCTKRVYVKFTEPKVCTVGIYSTYESRYLYSLGEYI